MNSLHLNQAGRVLVLPVVTNQDYKMKMLFLILTVLWLFDPRSRHVLQESSSLGGPWSDIAGPYQLRTNGTKIEYFVPLTKTNQRFFRVLATNGIPWL